MEPGNRPSDGKTNHDLYRNPRWRADGESVADAGRPRFAVLARLRRGREQPAGPGFDVAVVYGGDMRTRIRQELVLGVGGVKSAARALGIMPGVYHLNEGHSAFAAVGSHSPSGWRMTDSRFDEALREGGSSHRVHDAYACSGRPTIASPPIWWKKHLGAVGATNWVSRRLN